MKSRTKSQRSAKLSYLFLIGCILLTTFIKSLNMPMPSQRAVILPWWQENWKWWSDRNKDTSKKEELKRLTCYSIFKFIICSNYTRCSGPWHRGWSKAMGTDNLNTRHGSWICWSVLRQYMTRCPYLLYDSCRVETGPGSDTNPSVCCLNKLHMVRKCQTSFWILEWGNSWLLLHTESINQALILGQY